MKVSAFSGIIEYNMAKLTKKEIAQVAELARIAQTDDQLEDSVKDVSSILGFVESLQAIDTSGIKPSSQVTGLTDVWREDVVLRCELSRDELLANAPLTQDGYIKVKKVL